ncbi:hypothetical protein DSCA_24610 [Desulfosarcina alkanivorans]|uniref:Uncharacterized protein n=1 Tax=Desulfosarcina alkanivorans TaxID=571177 RepID=A0A5K7YNP4_9BACT|nr:hypothetical protein DSCA_24610 [Desulfosarcina alkanivorans]
MNLEMIDLIREIGVPGAIVVGVYLFVRWIMKEIIPYCEIVIKYRPPKHDAETTTAKGE